MEAGQFVRVYAYVGGRVGVGVVGCVGVWMGGVGGGMGCNLFQLSFVLLQKKSSSF